MPRGPEGCYGCPCISFMKDTGHGRVSSSMTSVEGAAGEGEREGTCQ